MKVQLKTDGQSSILHYEMWIQSQSSGSSVLSSRVKRVVLTKARIQVNTNPALNFALLSRKLDNVLQLQCKIGNTGC